MVVFELLLGFGKGLRADDGRRVPELPGLPGQVEVKVREAPQEMVVLADPARLQQVFLNLIRIAWEGMVDVHDRARRLAIRTELGKNDHVRFSVKDVGQGIDIQAMHQIFDAFYSTKLAGMGVGLSVSRAIIERHNGRLWAEPNEPHGANLLFSLPAVYSTLVQGSAVQ